MKAYSIPVLRKTDPKKWYIDWQHTVPVELREALPHLFPRAKKRIKKYGDINMYQGDERERNAEALRDDWEFCLKNLNYDPFAKLMATLNEVTSEEAIIAEEINAEQKLSEEDKRKLTPISKAFDLYLESREARTSNGNSMSTHRSTIKWITAYFNEKDRLKDPISSVKRLEIAGAVNKAKKDRAWSNTTYNNEVTNIMTVFNWLASEEYILINPGKAKIQKLNANVTIHKWYDRVTMRKVQRDLLIENIMPVYYAMAFTYLICIRSKGELMKLKARDIDRTLKRVHFSADLSKNGVECYRDYNAEFDRLLDEMNFDKIPSNFYIFGKNGEPSDKKCHKDFLAVSFRPIRDRLALSDKYTIYSMKHTRVIHMMMMKVDPYEIMHILRHTDLESTMAYMRQFNISDKNVYKAGDLNWFES